MSSGPIAWLKASTQARLTSSASAMPSSTIRAASTMRIAIRREVTKPWASLRQTIVCLP